MHSDRGSQYTSWVFGHRLRDGRPARLDGPGRLQRGQLDDRVVLVDHATRAARHPHAGTTRASSASAIFEWIEAWYNPRRRHTALGKLSPVDYEHHCEALHTAADASGMITTPTVSGEPGQAP